MTVAMPARAIDTATISFGLVSIPVKIYSSNEPSKEIHFHLLHAGCGQRLQQRYVCPEHGEVDRSEMIKGYEYARGHYVELSKEELKALEEVASEAIALREFVPIHAVDPIYVDATYYLGPAKGGEHAYKLLATALDKTGLAGVASYAARGKAYIVLLRPFEDGLAMHQLRYPDEIKPWDEVPLPELARAKGAELELAEKLIQQVAADAFDPTPYKDVVKARMAKAIKRKVEGEEIVAPEPAAAKAAPVDLMAALKASLEGKGAAATARRAVPHRNGKARAARASRRTFPRTTRGKHTERRKHA